MRKSLLTYTDEAVLKLFSGIHENVVTAIVNIDGLRAVVLEPYSSGNAVFREKHISR